MIDQIYAMVMQNRYLTAVAIFVLFFIASKLVLWVSEKVFLRATKKTKTKLDDMLVKAINKPASFILLLIGFKLGFIYLGFNETVNQTVVKIINSLLGIIGFWLLAKVLDVLIDQWGRAFAEKTKSTMDDHLISLGHRFTRVLIFVFGLLFVLSQWGVQIGPMLASLGIAGIAVAFALQSTLGNIFGGISIIIDKTVKVGDIIKLDDGSMGTVFDVGIRATRVKTWDNEILTVPNGKIADMIVQNFSQPDMTSRINIEVGVAYGSDPDKVKKVILNTVKKIPHIMKDPEPRVLFLTFGDSALNFKAMFYVDDLANKWPTHQEAITKIYKAFNRNKINIPFPQMDVHMKK